MKCLVIETSNARPYSAAHPVTNEDGTPHIYATISEARAELKANGYSYSREADRYYIKGTDARAYIVREDSEQYAEIMEQAEEQAAPEYIEPEHIQTVSGNKIYRSIDPVTGWTVFAVAGRDFWELAEARYFAQCNPAEAIADHTAASHDHEPRPTYQRYELEAFLGEPDEYDVEAIEAEATEADPRTGRTYWTPEAVADLWSICERHELYTYAPVA